MSVNVSVGVQWGDEGKAKIVDYLSENSDVVVRFQGGANAGHTVYVDNKKYVFHLIPAGVIYNKICLISSGVAFDIDEFLKERSQFAGEGLDVSKILIDKRAHIVMPYHKLEDRYCEERSNGKIGTTGRGIGPTYSDRAQRDGIRVADLENPKLFKQKLKDILEYKNFLISEYYGKEPILFEDIYNEIMNNYEQIKNNVVDGYLFLNNAIKDGKNVLFEGAQGTMLDLDYGTYPFVTSSNTVAGFSAISSGISPLLINKIYGVCKAYTTRVGNGPFPTELFDDLGKKIRKSGKEFGATTGRPRRCGWLDLVALKYTVLINGITDLVITKLDILSGFKTIKVAVNYILGDKKLDGYPAVPSLLDNVEMDYVELPGWDEDISDIKNVEDLPENAYKYLKFIEEFVGVNVSIVSVGPNRNQTFLK